MKTRHLWKALFIGLLAMGIISCKDEINERLQSIRSAEDHATAEAEFASIFDFVDEEAKNNPNIFGKKQATTLPACAYTDYDSTSRELTIYFYDSANTYDTYPNHCLCEDGIYRKGTIRAAFSGNYREAGATATVTLENYSRNNYPITGTKVIENLGNGSGNFKYSVTVSNASITTESGTISWSAQREVERIQGEGTVTPWDDIYIVTGQASGTNRNGVDFTVTIDENTPLKKKIEQGCLTTFVSGKLTLKNTDGGQLDVDYDPDNNEACDKIVAVTIDGKTKRFTVQ